MAPPFLNRGNSSTISGDSDLVLGITYFALLCSPLNPSEYPLSGSTVQVRLRASATVLPVWCSVVE